MRTLTKKLTVIPALVLSFVLLTGIALAGATVVVTGDTAGGENQPGWLFNRDTSTSTPYEFNTDEASIGIGSLYVEPIGTNPSDKFIGENFLMEEMGNVNSVDYDFLIGSGGTVSDANHFYMNVYANFAESDPNKYYDCRYDIVPSTGSTTNWTTVTFDPSQSYPVTERSSSPQVCPVVPADMGSDATLRMFALNVGDTSNADLGLDGYLDNVVVNLNSETTIYDFEPALTPETKDECKKDGWMMFNSPSFKNQGDCVSYVASDGKAQGNPNR